jgi:phosphotransferase system  glucose/maltose/N-acetylglucosamine-specific IIC component
MANTARNVANVVYALAVGLAAAALAIFGPIVVAFVAAWTFNYFGLTRLRDLAGKIPSYFAFFVVLGVAVGLTTCLRVLGRRFRKEPEPRSFR